MTYALGVDLGTTYSAAAVYDGDAAQVVTLGHRMTVVPSAVFVTADGDVLVGAAAVRRGAAEPDRLAREFKRRMGDSVPLIVGGAPWSAESLTAHLLRWIVGQVTEQHGGPPDRLTVTYPANWGAFKQDRLAQALRMSELDHATTLTEPEAAARWYASVERVAVGEVVAVYDLGGGTFDAAILRKTATGFEVPGAPEGIERLGGIDVDEAVLAHVLTTLDARLELDDREDPGTALAIARLRADCVEAKEALSSDTHVSIPVALQGKPTTVRLTRTELEGMVSPLIEASTAALRRAIRSSGLAPGDVDRVLLVGGASRMPLVGRMVSGALGRPFFIDAHPKHAVCLGAAISTDAERPAPETQEPATSPQVTPEPATRQAPVQATPQSTLQAPPTVGVPDWRAPAPVVDPAFGDGGASRLDHGRPPRRLAVGVVSVVAVVVVVLLAVLLAPDRDTPGATPSTTDPAGTTEPSAPTLRQAGSAPLEDATALAVMDDDVWVAARSSGTVARFDAELADPPEEVVTLGRSALASELVAADGAIWVAASYPAEDDAGLSDTELVRLDSAGETVSTVPLGPTDSQPLLAAGAGSIWLLTSRPNDTTAASDPVLFRVDPATDEVVAEIAVGAGTVLALQDIVAGDDRVWIAATDTLDGGATSARIIAVDPARDAVVDDEEIDLGVGAAGDMALGASGLWAIHWGGGPRGGDVILRIDPASGDTTAELPVAANRIAASDDWIWVYDAADGLDSIDDTVRLIDPESAQVVSDLAAPGDLTALAYLAASDDTAWFTLSSQVHRVDLSR